MALFLILYQTPDVVLSMLPRPVRYYSTAIREIPFHDKDPDPNYVFVAIRSITTTEVTGYYKFHPVKVHRAPLKGVSACFSASLFKKNDDLVLEAIAAEVITYQNRRKRVP